MKNNIKNLLILSVMCSALSAKEISVLDAGNLDSQTPYGLTKAEQVVSANTEKLNTLSTKVQSLSSEQENKINSLSLKYDSLNSKQNELLQKIEGISSLFESDSKRLNNAKLNVKNNENKIEEQKTILSNRIDANTNKLELLDKKVDDFIAKQKQNMKVLEEQNVKLTAILNKINVDYVKKAEFDELVVFINKNNEKSKPQSFTAKSDKIAVESIVKDKDIAIKKKSNKENFEDAVKLFKSKQFDKSSSLFEALIGEKYKSAESNFYYAEIKFKQKLYKEAIPHYKQSMIADDKASYIPTLLLHSALSFENMKEKDNAANFYKTIVEIYPDSAEAKEASKKIKNKNKDKKNDKIK